MGTSGSEKIQGLWNLPVHETVMKGIIDALNLERYRQSQSEVFPKACFLAGGHILSPVV